MRSLQIRSLVLTLLVSFALSAPSAFAVTRDGSGPGRDLPIFQKVIKILRTKLHLGPNDDLSVPKP